MKKIIAKHIIGLTGTVILWFILNYVLVDWMPKMRKDGVLQPAWKTTSIDNGGFLLLGMLVGYIVIYWAVKTIWFDKDKDGQKGD